MINKNNYNSQGNSSSFENKKLKVKNKFNNNYNSYNNYETKELLLMNKYSPGYIYYKAYQNVIEKLHKKKILSGKIIFQRNNDKKITEIKKRYKSGNIRNITKSNTNCRYNNFIKNQNLKNYKKGNDINYNNKFSKTCKTPFIFKNYFTNIYSNIINKKNPYSINWANKLLNFNDIYLGVNFHSNVPLLKSLNIKR